MFFIHLINFKIPTSTKNHRTKKRIIHPFNFNPQKTSRTSDNLILSRSDPSKTPARNSSHRLHPPKPKPPLDPIATETKPTVAFSGTRSGRSVWRALISADAPVHCAGQYAARALSHTTCVYKIKIFMCGVYVHVVWSCARVSRVRVWVTAASVCVRATYTARARGAFAQCNLHYRLSLIMRFFLNFMRFWMKSISLSFSSHKIRRKFLKISIFSRIKHPAKFSFYIA